MLHGRKHEMANPGEKNLIILSLDTKNGSEGRRAEAAGFGFCLSFESPGLRKPNRHRNLICCHTSLGTLSLG